VLRKITNEKIAKLQKGDELPPGVIKMVKGVHRMKRKLSVGDKMAGRHGNKGVIARILLRKTCRICRWNSGGDCVESLGVPSRMNVGQILRRTWLGCPCAGRENCGADQGKQRCGLHARTDEEGVRGTATLRQLLELDDEMLLRVGQA